MKQHSAVEREKKCHLIRLLTLCCIINLLTTFTYSKPIQINCETTLNGHQTQRQQIQDASLIQKASNIEFQFNKQADPSMQLHKLSISKSNNITCNDGSSIGYYKRLNNHSKSWIIYLQGGGFCASEESCNQRWQRTPYLMSSNYWSKSKTGKLTHDTALQKFEYP